MFSSTRSEKKLAVLASLGVDHPILDKGDNVASSVRSILREGVQNAIELVGTGTSLPETLTATAVHGTVCFAGMLSDQWTIPDFYPIAYLPIGVRLSAYTGGAGNLPSQVANDYITAVAEKKAVVPIDRVFRFDEIREAHRLMEAGAAAGKLVVLIGAGDVSF